MKIKYRIFPFLILTLLAGCVGKTSNADKSAANSAAIDAAKHYGGLMDSIRETSFLTLVQKDSIELLAVKHVLIDTYHVEQILFLDYHIDRSYDRENPDKSYKDLRKSFPIPDGLSMTINPFPEMMGNYISVFRYKGKYVTSDVSDDVASSSSEMVIADSAMLWFFMMPDIMLYQEAEKSDGKITYVVTSSSGNPDTIEIKKLGGDLNLQLWKWPRFGNTQYLLRVPSQKAMFLPHIIERNTFGVEGSMMVQFDKINYDSLMSTK